MIYSFSSKVAEKYGVDSAVFIHNIMFWIIKNKANDKNFFEKKFWSYNSKTALKVLFPFFSVDKISRIVIKLKKNKIIETKTLNRNPFNRTNWYTIVDNFVLDVYEFKHISPTQNRTIDHAKSHNRSCEIAQSHYAKSHNEYTDSKQYSKHTYIGAVGKEDALQVGIDAENSNNTPTKPSQNKNKTKKKKYLDFVMLTEEEWDKLSEKYGETTIKDYIERLNNYIGSTGKKYKSHYHTILTWTNKETRKNDKYENVKYL